MIHCVSLRVIIILVILVLIRLIGSGVRANRRTTLFRKGSCSLLCRRIGAVTYQVRLLILILGLLLGVWLKFCSIDCKLERRTKLGLQKGPLEAKYKIGIEYGS